MSRIDDILLRARDTLADPDSRRYTNDRLLRLLSDAQKDISIRARLIRSRVQVQLYTDIAEYALPDNCWSVSRVTLNDSPLDLTTYDILDDSVSSTWQSHKSLLPEAIVYDRANQAVFRVYPIPSGEQVTAFSTFNSVLGVVTDIAAADPFSEFGIVTDLEIPDYNTQISAFGAITDIDELLPMLEVQYFATSNTLVNTSTPLQVPTLFDNAMKYYVTSMALRDDLDTQSRQVGSEEFRLYERELELAMKLSSTNFTEPRAREVKYTTAFNINNKTPRHLTW